VVWVAWLLGHVISCILWVVGCINSPGHVLEGREGRGLDIYCIYKLCKHDIKITEPLSPRWHGKLLEHQVGGEKFPLMLKLLGTNSM